MQDRSIIVHENFINKVTAGDLPHVPHRNIENIGLSSSLLKEIFISQITSRHLDNCARRLKERGESFYTIGSAGHEGNAAIAAAFRINDMAFLHYRDAAFLIQRAKLKPSINIILDMMLSFVASKNDPISGGRHKVLGSKELYIPPQTSTIASHLPKAVGAASSIGLNRHIRQEGTLPQDAVILCSFGDASLNHSTAQGAINTACWTAYQKMHMPIIFICEDNGIGISTPTPSNWVYSSVSNRPALTYFSCNGLDIIDTYQTSVQAASYTRKTRKPAFLHMKCIRLFGHAGADAQHVYLTEEEIINTEAQDPLLYSAAIMVKQEILTTQEILKLYHDIENEVNRCAEIAIKQPKLETAAEVMAPIIPPSKTIATTPNKPSAEQRSKIFGNDIERMRRPNNMARLINWTLADLMLEHKNIVLAGEDIGKKGGVYSVTSKLQDYFGKHRVIDTLLDEQSILGLAIGLAHNNILPIAEIQFLAYLHNAEDQLRGEAATLSFFSKGQYSNPMIIRIAGLAYQKGFGGHFHNDNSIAVLRDIPGIIIACPSNGLDAVGMLREAIRLAREEQRIVVFLEPIALYMTKDLHHPKDGAWSYSYEEARQLPEIPLGKISTYGNSNQLAIISYGNGYFLSRQAAKILEDEHGIKSRIIDIRWLAPLPIEAILQSCADCQNIIIVDECRNTGSLSEALAAMLHERLSHNYQLHRITAKDCFIPLGKAATAPLPSVDDIINGALKLVGSTEIDHMKTAS